MEKQSESLINNALAILSAVGSRPSPIAEKEAAGFLAGKKDRNAYCRIGSENNRLFFRVLLALSKSSVKDFDVPAMIKLHSFIFDGLRPDAGKLRSTSLQLEGSNFTDASLIAGSLKRLLAKMNSLGSAPECSREDFALNLTHYFSEMFLLQPFKHGSVVVQSVFFCHFAVKHGYDFGLYRCGGARLLAAMKKAFFTDETTDLFLCLSEAVSYAVSETEESEVRVMEAVQVKRELKRDIPRAKTLVKSQPKHVNTPKPKPPIKQKPPEREIKTNAGNASVKPRPEKPTNTIPKLETKASTESLSKQFHHGNQAPEKAEYPSVKPAENEPVNIVLRQTEFKSNDLDSISTAKPSIVMRTVTRKRGSIAIADNLLAEIAASCADLIQPEQLVSDPIEESSESEEAVAETGAVSTKLAPLPTIRTIQKRNQSDSQPASNIPSTAIMTVPCEPINADLSRLSSGTLKKAARLKEKIEQLQNQLRILLNENEE